MKLVVPLMATFALLAASSAHAQTSAASSVAPALESYTNKQLLGDVWKRPGLSARDRSIVTLAVLISRGQAGDLPFYYGLALDNGVKPAEISEIITHLAFYTGWPNASAALPAAKDEFTTRGVRADQLPKAAPQLLPIDQAAEADRASRVGAQFGAAFPGVVQTTTDMLFKDLWLRPDLAPRDRSLVTVAALVTTGQVAQLPSHLNRAMDNGLTAAETGEAFAHLAFYAGWPRVFSAMPVAKDVFEKRAKPQAANQ